MPLSWPALGPTQCSSPRVVESAWTWDYTTGTDYHAYELDLSYDRNSNITWAEDQWHNGRDVLYSMDGLNRLGGAQRGDRSGSAITLENFHQEWTLDQTGNWELFKNDLNGDGDWGDTNEVEDNRSHNTVNELETREYVLQNWRADVVALVNPATYGDGNSLQEAGRLIERITYDAYGIPFATHPTDLTKGAIAATSGYGMPDGVLNNDDYSYFLILYGNTDPRADWNKDGTLSAADSTAFLADYGAATGSWGRGVLSNRQNILGYAGYVHEPATGAAGGGHGTMWHVRHRVLHAGLGRWIQRDPTVHQDTRSIFAYSSTNPMRYSSRQGTNQIDRTAPKDIPELDPCVANEWDHRAEAIWDQLQSTCPGMAAAIERITCITCAEDADHGKCGAFVPGNPPEIKVCSDPAAYCGSMSSTLVHELTHALQACKYGLYDEGGNLVLPTLLPDETIDPDDPVWGPWIDPMNVFCQELQAYQNDGQCSDWDTLPPSPSYPDRPYRNLRECECDRTCNSTTKLEYTDCLLNCVFDDRFGNDPSEGGWYNRCHDGRWTE